MYGSYSPSVDDIEKNYRTTLSKTNLRSDRGDLNLHTFAGSNLHGGAPAAEKLSAPKSRSGMAYSHDLYAPINTREYGKGYYDTLRATSPERRSVHKPGPYYDLLLDGSEYRTTTPTRTKRVTTTEHWVPLTSHIYHSPHHAYYYSSSPYSSYTYRTSDDRDLYSYDYVNDYKRYSTTKTVDALDLSTSKNYELYADKCYEVQKQLDEVKQWVSEAESKLKSEVISSRSRMQSELADLSLVVEDTAKYNDDLHRVIKKQAKQISQIGSQNEVLNRHLVDISDAIEKSRARCQSLQSDLSSVQTALAVQMKRRY